MPASALSLVLPALCLVMPTLAVMASNWMPIAVALAALAVLARRWGETGTGGAVSALTPRPAPALVLVALGLIWAAVASSWTFVPERALLLVLRLALLVLAGCLLLDEARRLDAAQRRKAARWLLTGLAIGAAVFLFERVTGSALHFLLGDPSPNRSVLSTLNRGATGLALLVWPATAVLLHAGRRVLALLLPAALFAMMLLSESQSAIVATGVGIGVVVLAIAAPRAARLLAFAIVIVGVLGAPFIAKAIYTPDAFDQGWIERNAQHRLYIWNYVADRIVERPLAGWGFDSSHAMPNFGIEPFENERRPLPSHPHNAVLQIWLELGAVGAILAAGFLLALWRGIGRLPPSDRAAATALLLSGLTMASVSYGIWQSQWLAALLGAAVAAVAVREEPESP